MHLAFHLFGMVLVEGDYFDHRCDYVDGVRLLVGGLAMLSVSKEMVSFHNTLLLT